MRTPESGGMSFRKLKRYVSHLSKCDPTTHLLIIICSGIMMRIWSPHSNKPGKNKATSHVALFLQDAKRAFTHLVNSQITSESSGRFAGIVITGPMPRASDSVNLGWGLEVTLLTNSQVMLMLRVPGTHFENHCTDFI